MLSWGHSDCCKMVSNLRHHWSAVRVSDKGMLEFGTNNLQEILAGKKADKGIFNYIFTMNLIAKPNAVSQGDRPNFPHWWRSRALQICPRNNWWRNVCYFIPVRFCALKSIMVGRLEMKISNLLIWVASRWLLKMFCLPVILTYISIPRGKGIRLVWIEPSFYGFFTVWELLSVTDAFHLNELW